MLANLDFDAREGVEGALTEDELLAICEAVLAAENVTRPCYVSVTLVDDDEMRENNLEWRDVDAATDVISLECERPDDPDLAEDEPCELGDILLAPDYIARQAARFGTTPADETRLLFVHGLLHLLGYDHLEDDEAEEMEAREDELLKLVPTDGTLDHVMITRHREDA